MISEAASAAFTDPSRWNERLLSRCLRCVRCVQARHPGSWQLPRRGFASSLVQMTPWRFDPIVEAVALGVADRRGQCRKGQPPAGIASVIEPAATRCPALGPRPHRARRCGRSAGPRDLAQPGARAAANTPLPGVRWPQGPTDQWAETSPSPWPAVACQKPPRPAGAMASETLLSTDVELDTLQAARLASA